jgi:hypothetical protein
VKRAVGGYTALTAAKLALGVIVSPAPAIAGPCLFQGDFVGLGSRGRNPSWKPPT